MKRRVLFLIIVPLIVILIFYFSISSPQTFSISESVQCPQTAALRLLTTKPPADLFPGIVKEHRILFQEWQIESRQPDINGVGLTFSKADLQVNSYLQAEYLSQDSSQLVVNSTVALSGNPIVRILQYVRLQEGKKALRAFLATMKQRFENKEFVYGMKIEVSRVTDSTMIAVKKTYTHYPTVEEIYSQADAIKNYILQQGGLVTNNPMLYVSKTDSTHYETMIAVPTKNNVKPAGNFELKLMLPGGLILTADITGGINRILTGEQELKNYANDQRRVSPAIPYQLLLTDRRQVTDTAQWKTRLYYPIYF